ncbi:MAG: acyltransferase family protein [Candidatus Bathyarchaeota archaeon]|nr:acyltransferase family protein [Candidatus Bathyarchaeota archaeon]
MYQQDKGINLPVDLIRTVAIILVILLHASIEPAPTIDIMSPQGVELWWASNIYNSVSRVCVPLFVMLTGALLLQPSKTDEPLRVFFKKRWKRIGIPVLFWMAVFFAWRYFVNGEVLTLNSIVQGIIVGPYTHFWFVYLIVGLYLLTPIIRIIVAHANWSLIKYFFLIWIVGTGVFPLLRLFANIGPQITWFNETVFVLSGMIGYFIFGAYAGKLRPRTSLLVLLLTVGSLWTIFGTYFLVGTMGEAYSQFFMDASSLNVILAATSLFMLLAAVPHEKVGVRFPRLSRALKVISENTLPIYLFHVIVLETLQKGYLGFKLSVLTLNPLIEIPLITGVTLLICLVIIVPLKKIPHVKSIIG